jgi:Fur family transcriptional regulator, ferric uptake regulator
LTKNFIADKVVIMRKQEEFGSKVATHSQVSARQVDRDKAVHGGLSAKLASAGIRMTRQRRVLLEILDQSDAHLDARTLCERAQKKIDIDRATVYRTLELLKQKGLIDELDLMHLHGEMHYFEARTGSEHFHLACYGCGKITEVEDGMFERLKKHVALHEGFKVQTARLEIGGYCRACTAQHKKKSRV